MDPRIGILIKNGKEVFYAYVNDYNQEPVEGTLEQVEMALGLRQAVAMVAEAKHAASKEYNVTLTYQYPSWSTVDGIVYRNITASSKSDAIKQARKMAEDGGNAIGGLGRYWFKAEEQE